MTTQTASAWAAKISTRTFLAPLWDPIYRVTEEFAQGPWRAFRDTTFHTLHVLYEVTGAPKISRTDLELMAFAFCLVQLVLDESLPRNARTDEFSQRLAAEIHRGLPREGLPAPLSFWDLVCRRGQAYEECIEARGPGRKFAIVVEELMGRYGLTPSDDGDVLRGLCRALSPVVAMTRALVKAYRETIAGQEPPSVPGWRDNPFADLDLAEVDRALERIDGGDRADGP